MSGKWCDEGEHDILEVYLVGTPAFRDTLYLGLFTNTTEPAENATLASLTEPSGNGYARIALDHADWTVVADLATHVQKTFTSTPGAWGDIWGYFVCTVDSGTSGLLLGVEAFSGGKYTVGAGGSVKVTPKLTAA